MNLKIAQDTIFIIGSLASIASIIFLPKKGWLRWIIFSIIIIVTIICIFYFNYSNPSHSSENRAIEKKTSEKTLNDSLLALVVDSKSNYYITSFHSYDIITIRNRPLTDYELKIINGCSSYIDSKKKYITKDICLTTSAEIIYQNPNNEICVGKKNIDKETNMGFILSGVVVQLIESNMKFYHIKILNSGIDGWIASKLNREPTLAKGRLFIVPEGYELVRLPR